MGAEIVSIGSELLLGQIVDTNAAFIARYLAAIGLDVFHQVTGGDNRARIAAALTTVPGRADVAITTGGLGPTADDVTREAAAQAAGRALVLVPALLRASSGAAAHAHRLGGDLGQVRVRASVTTLNRPRRPLATGSA